MGAYSRRSTRSSARIADSIAPSELQRLDKMNTLPPLSLTTTNHLTAGFLGWQDDFNSISLVFLKPRCADDSTLDSIRISARAIHVLE